VAKDHLDELRFKTILSILLPAVIGVPAGIWILSVISAGQLKTAAGVVIAAFALLAAADFSFMKKARIGRPYVFGFLSGVLNGSVSLSGPPIIAYFSMERLRKDSFRSNISAYFFLLNIVTLAGMIPAGLCGTDEVLASAGLLPALLLGTAAGVRISRHIDEVLFRRVTLGLLFILGASTVIL
jgi:uncharacterized membrane protein YfcA